VIKIKLLTAPYSKIMMYKSPIANAIAVTAGAMTRNAPISVATPLPPLNLDKIGKQCPTTTANPTAYIAISPTSNLIIKTGITPFKIS